MAMKLVFQGGEHPPFPLPEGSWCIGSSLDADVLLLQTRVNRITASADARMAWFRLLKSAGRL